MNFEKDTRGIQRYIGFDIHKEYALVGGQNARQDWVMTPRRVEMEKFPDSVGICGHGVTPDMEVAMSKLCSQF
jgi:hypothetical protein